MTLGNRGLAVGRLTGALVAVFVLTIIFTYFDPVIEDDLHAQGISMVTNPTATNILNKFLNQWHWWVPMFLLAIFIYAVSSGGETYTTRGERI